VKGSLKLEKHHSSIAAIRYRESTSHEVGSNTFADLQQLFGSEKDIIRELQHRFDSLPMHSIVYYHSYHQGVLQILITTINIRSGQH